MHSSLPLRLRFTYTGLLLLVWQGEAAFFAVAALWLLCFGAEQYFALQMRLAWAVRQVRPIVVSQEYPGDPRTRSTANEIRDLLIRAGNENLVQRDSKGKVLVVDGEGSLRCALLGDMLAEAAIKNEWEGIIVNGCVRDSVALNNMPIGVKALNTNPTRSVKKYPGLKQIEVGFANVFFEPDDYVYCDEDGILLSDYPLI